MEYNKFEMENYRTGENSNFGQKYAKRGYTAGAEIVDGKESSGKVIFSSKKPILQ